MTSQTNRTRPTYQVVALSAELHRRADWFQRTAEHTGHPGREDRYRRLCALFRDTADDLSPNPSDQSLRDAHALLTLTFRRPR